MFTKKLIERWIDHRFEDNHNRIQKDTFSYFMENIYMYLKEKTLSSHREDIKVQLYINILSVELSVLSFKNFRFLDPIVCKFMSGKLVPVTTERLC